MHGALANTSFPLKRNHLDRFIRFCTAPPCAQHRQTDHATSEKCRKEPHLSTRCRRCGLIIFSVQGVTKRQPNYRSQTYTATFVVYRRYLGRQCFKSALYQYTKHAQRFLLKCREPLHVNIQCRHHPACNSAMRLNRVPVVYVRAMYLKQQLSFTCIVLRRINKSVSSLPRRFST